MYEFRESVKKSHTCAYWESADELKSILIISLTKAIKRNPAIGWVRADSLPSENTLKELLDLRKRNEELESLVKNEVFSQPDEVEQLYQGNDLFKVECKFRADISSKGSNNAFVSYNGKFEVTWNDIWAAISPILVNEATNFDIKRTLNSFFEKTMKGLWEGKEEIMTIYSISIDDDVYNTIIIQFRALGMIKLSLKQRSVKDTDTYWTLTKYGDSFMMKLKALRKDKNRRKIKGAKTISR